MVLIFIVLEMKDELFYIFSDNSHISISWDNIRLHTEIQLIVTALKGLKLHHILNPL